MIQIQTFPVSNINFGIIRRPEQNIELTKRVSHFKFTLPTGQVLIDAEIKQDGTVTGATNYFAYPPIDDRVKRENIAVRVEMDENLIQGSTVQITYELKVRNTSEADYTSEGYYNYGEAYYIYIAEEGEREKESDIVKFTSTSIIDYISENSQLDIESNTDNAWTTIPVDNEYISLDVQKALKGTELDEKYQLYKSTPLKTELIPEFSVGGIQVENSGNAVYTYIVEGEPINTKDGANYQNQAEVIEIVKTGGGRITSTPGNYVPNKNSNETPDTDDSTSELISISPSTGENRNYVLPVLIIIVVLTTLEIVIYLIRKRFTRSKT